MRRYHDADDILVYCKSGARRSALMAAILIITLTGRALDSTVALLKVLRPITDLTGVKRDSNSISGQQWLHIHLQQFYQARVIRPEYERSVKSAVVSKARCILFCREVMQILQPPQTPQKRVRIFMW